MNKYFMYMLTSAKRELYYKTNMAGMVVTSMFVLIIQVKLWEAIYMNNSVISGITYTGIFAYLVGGMIFRKFIGGGIDDMISGDFQSGKIAIDILRPQNYFFKSLCFDLGRGVVHFVVISCISILYLIWNKKYVKYYEPKIIIGAVMSAIIAYFIYILMSYCIGLTSVWFGRSVGLSMIKEGLFSLLGGTMIPLDFYPVWLQRIVDVLPFKYIYYAPISFFINESNQGKFCQIIIMQLIWCVIFAVAGKIIYNAASRHMVIQGG